MIPNFQKGQRLFVETDTETMEGEFVSFNSQNKVIVLKNCVLHPSGEKLEGLNRYYLNELKSIRSLDPMPHPAADKDSEAAGNWNLMHKSKVSPRHERPSGKVTAGDVVMNKAPGSSHYQQSRKPKLTVETYDEMNKRIRSSVMVQRKGKFFMDVVDDIKAEHCIGVSFEVAMLGRNSPIVLMCVATKERAFVFDIKAFGEVAFQNELKEILQSEQIEKVIHDCRMVSDCLYHKHNVVLKKVFDTQVADIMITKNIQGNIPKNTKSLPECLSSYLNLPETLIYQPRTYDGYVGKDLDKWSERPLSCDLQMAMVKNTVFLLALKEKLIEKMLCNFYRGVDIFLNVVKDAEPEDAHDHVAKAALVPREFLILDKEKDDTEEQIITGNGFSRFQL